MKKIRLLSLILFIFLSCKSQTTLPLYLSSDYVAGNYYQDIDFDLNKFEGTWLVTNDLMTFKIILKKREHVFSTYDNSFSDMIVGEYQYIVDGVEQTNTLANIDNYTTPYGNNSIYGGIIYRCDTCAPGKKDRIYLTLFDPVTAIKRSMSMSAKVIKEDGIFKLKVGLHQHLQMYTEDEMPIFPANYIPIEDGSYILTKQP